MELRIAGSGGPMAEQGDHEAGSRKALAATASTRPARVALEVPERLTDGVVMSVAGCASDVAAADAVEQRDGLRRREREVETKHSAPTSRLDAERAQELVLAHGAREPLVLGARAVPLAFGLAVACVVVLASRRDRVDVVARVSLAAADLADREHAA